jgi:hypothetical protein
MSYRTRFCKLISALNEFKNYENIPFRYLFRKGKHPQGIRCTYSLSMFCYSESPTDKLLLFSAPSLILLKHVGPGGTHSYSPHTNNGTHHTQLFLPPPFPRWQYSNDWSPNSPFILFPLVQWLFRQLFLFNLHVQFFVLLHCISCGLISRLLCHFLFLLKI